MADKAKHKLLEEQKIHEDIIQVKNFIEHYNNLTLKTLFTLKFFLDKGRYKMSVYMILSIEKNTTI